MSRFWTSSNFCLGPTQICRGVHKIQDVQDVQDAHIAPGPHGSRPTWAPAPSFAHKCPRDSHLVEPLQFSNPFSTLHNLMEQLLLEQQELYFVLRVVRRLHNVSIANVCSRTLPSRLRVLFSRI